MLAILASAALSCAGVPELSPPEPGARFTYAAPGGFFMHAEVISSDRNGHVRVRSMVDRQPSAPGSAMMAGAPADTTFMGMILIENGNGRSFRRRSPPRDLMVRVNALNEGETASFSMMHEVNLGGERRRFSETHAITFLGCSSVQTEQGALQTRRYGVDTAGMAMVRGEPQINRTRTEIDIAVDYGWSAQTLSGRDQLRLRRADVGR